MASGLEATLKINAKDDTAGALAGLKKHIEEIDKQAALADKIMTQMAKVAKSTDPLAKQIGEAHKAFAAQREEIIAASAAMEKFDGSTNAAGHAQARLRDMVERATAAIGEQGAAAVRAGEKMARAPHAPPLVTPGAARPHGGGLRHAVEGALPFEGPEILEGTKKAIESGADVQHIRVGMKQAGIGDEEIAAIEARSLQLSTKLRNVSQAHLMELAREVRSVMTAPSEALEVLEPLATAKSILDARDPTGEASEGLGSLIKGAEAIGAAKDPERLKGLIDRYVKGIEVMGKTVAPEAIYDFDKRSRLAGASLSDRFLGTTGLSLIQEMGGETAGVGANMFYKQLAGGFQNAHTAAKEFVRLGLLDPGSLDYTKHGEIKGILPGHPHALKNDTAMRSDPDQWVWSTLVPALVKAGIKSQSDQLAEVRKMFPNSSAADVVGKLISQRESYEAHAKMYAGATGLAGVDLNAQDAMAGLSGLTTQIGTFAGVLTSPVMKDAGRALDTVAAGIGKLSVGLSGFQKDHPKTAEAIGAGAIGTGAAIGGWLTLKLMSGLGRLFGSAPVAEGVAAGGEGVAGGAALGEGVAAGGAAIGLGSATGIGALLIAGSAAAAKLIDELGPNGPLGYLYRQQTGNDFPDEGMVERSRRSRLVWHDGMWSDDPEAAHARAMSSLPDHGRPPAPPPTTWGPRGYVPPAPPDGSQYALPSSPGPADWGPRGYVPPTTAPSTPAALLMPAATAPVQVTLTAPPPVTVEGSAQLENRVVVEVNPSAYFLALVDRVERALVTIPLHAISLGGRMDSDAAPQRDTDHGRFGRR